MAKNWVNSPTKGTGNGIQENLPQYNFIHAENPHNQVNSYSRVGVLCIQAISIVDR